MCLIFGLTDNDIVTLLVLSVLPGCGISRLMSYLYRGNKQLSYSQGLYSVIASTGYREVTTRQICDTCPVMIIAANLNR